MTSACLAGACDHSPYNRECADPDYADQPCCGYRVHVNDLGSDDIELHDDCPLFRD